MRPDSLYFVPVLGTIVNDNVTLGGAMQRALNGNPGGISV
jgi:hypothetical protein